VGPRAGLDDMEKRKFWPYRVSNSDPSVVQPVASRCTDCAIPTHINGKVISGLIWLRIGTTFELPPAGMPTFT
jgi:hypothetical protein